MDHGTDGSDGTDGDHGTDEIDGDHGTDGTDGDHGTDETDGTKGTEGPNSIQKLQLLLFGYDGYKYFDNTISFIIYFISLFQVDSHPLNLTFTINIIFSRKKRNLENANKIVTCSLESNTNFLKYNCKAKIDENLKIYNVIPKNDFNFGTDCDIAISPQELYSGNYLTSQIEERIGSADLIILKGKIAQENDNFSVKGNLNKKGNIYDHFNLTVYPNDIKTASNISCETKNKEINNFEIKCNKYNSSYITINNTVSFMGNSQLLVVINEGKDYIDQPTIEGNTKKYNNSIYQKKKTEKNALIISLSICISLIVIAAVIVLVKFRKKFFVPKKEIYETSEINNVINHSNN